MSDRFFLLTKYDDGDGDARQIEMDVPLIGRFSDQVQADAGIAPDVEARQTANAIAEHHEPMTRALFKSGA